MPQPIIESLNNDMTEHFYSSIAKYYRYIFPFNPAQISFLKRVLPYNGAKILDVGCATGDLSCALVRKGFSAWAFDLDAQMIEIAENARQDDSIFPVFEQLDMRLIDQHYPELFFETVICYGNTLVHLQSDDDLRQFLQAVQNVLSPEGKLTIQILNYAHILEHQIKSLPLIDNETIRFERSYEFGKDSNLIHFNTKLIIKSSGEEICNSVTLNPVCKNKLQKLLEEARFGTFEFFGTFAGEPLSETSLTLIVTCKKE